MVFLAVYIGREHLYYLLTPAPTQVEQIRRGLWVMWCLQAGVVAQISEAAARPDILVQVEMAVQGHP